MKKYNTLSGMPQIQFNKGEKKFEAMNPKDDKVVESMYGTYVKPKSKQRLARDNPPNSIEEYNKQQKEIKYNADRGIFVQDGKPGALTDHIDFRLAEANYGDPETFGMTVPEYQKEKAKVKKYLAEAKGYNKPLRKFTDILDKRKRKTAKNDLDLYYSASTPKEKAQMRKQFKTYNFNKKMFKEDVKPILEYEIPSVPFPINALPEPKIDEAKIRREVEEIVKQRARPRVVGTGLDNIIDDAVFRLKNPWLNEKVESKNTKGDNDR